MDKLVTEEETIPPDPNSLNKDTVKKTCRNCGKEFDVKERRNPTPYCSIECYREKIHWTDDEDE
jgi:endogenous inhibitor of DNA gyrase (YacG/DUF329 family)